jgi:hypothetical protein
MAFRASMPKRHHNPPARTPTPAADARLTDERSQSQTVRDEPVLKLAQNLHQETTGNRPQVIDAANDTALLPVRLPEPSILYKSARHKPHRLPISPPAGSSSPGGAAAPVPRNAFEPLTRGGARNRADRRTDALRTEQVQSLRDAVGFAEAVGLPLSRFTTIHWERAGLSDGSRATTAFKRELTRLAARRGYTLAFAWVRENGPGKGDHVHILWHGPADWPDLEPCLRRAMKATGAVNRAKVRRTLSVGRSLRAALAGGPDYLANLGAVVGYLVKGASPEAMRTLGLDRSEPGGVVIGKRCGVSQNIGPEAWRMHFATKTRGRAAMTSPSTNVGFRT